MVESETSEALGGTSIKLHLEHVVLVAMLLLLVGITIVDTTDLGVVYLPWYDAWLFFGVAGTIFLIIAFGSLRLAKFSLSEAFIPSTLPVPYTDRADFDYWKKESVGSINRTFGFEYDGTSVLPMVVDAPPTKPCAYCGSTGKPSEAGRCQSCGAPR